MAWSDPQARETGDIITAAIWNQDVVDNGAYLYGQHPQSALLQSLESVQAAGGALTIANIMGSGWFGYAAYQNPAANGDERHWSVLLAQGVYTVKFLGYTSTGGGKADWSLDGVSITTGQEWYSGSTTYNVVYTVSSVAVAAGGRHLLKAVINGKNASSLGYGMYLTAIWFVRSAITQGV